MCIEKEFKSVELCTRVFHGFQKCPIIFERVPPTFPILFYQCCWLYSAWKGDAEWIDWNLKAWHVYSILREAFDIHQKSLDEKTSRVIWGCETLENHIVHCFFFPWRQECLCLKNKKRFLCSTRCLWLPLFSSVCVQESKVFLVKGNRKTRFSP